MIIGRKEEIKLLKDSGFEFKRKPENWLEAFEGLKDVIRKSDVEKKLFLLINFHGWILQRDQIMQYYMIFGGVPFYLEFPKKMLKSGLYSYNSYVYF